MIKTIIVGVILTLVGIFAFSKISVSSTGTSAGTSESAVDSSSGNGGTQEVEIAGEINHPGIYSMYPTDTLGALIAKAGGVTDDADSSAYVSTYVIGSRDYFYIPSSAGEVCEPVESAKVNINDTSLTAEEIKAGLGVTITQAQGIIDYRKENGAFSCIEELLDVKGIGQKTYEKIRGLVTLR